MAHSEKMLDLIALGKLLEIHLTNVNIAFAL